MKSWLRLSVVLLLCAGLTVGCSSSKKTESSQNNTGSKKEKTLDISLMAPQWGEQGPTDNSKLVKKLDKKLNIKLDLNWVAGPQFKKKLSVLAASQSLPDVYRIDQKDFIKWRDKGIFMDVKPSLSKYKNLTKYLTKDSYQVENPKGHYYGLPYHSLPHTFSTGIRQDWLDHLHLKMPKTIDQFYQVAKAFAKDDPDGDGKKDTIGFSISITPNGTFGNNADSLEGAFGLGNGWKLNNGKLVPMQAQTKQLKDFIGFLRKAYSEGVLDQDFASQKPPDIKKKFWNGELGITSLNPNEVYRTDLPKVKKVDPNAKISQMLPPKGPTGLAKVHTETDGKLKTVINANISSAKQQRILKLLNYMLSDEGYDLIKNGVEGVDYKKDASGKYVKINTGRADDELSVIFFRRADNKIQLHKWNDKPYRQKVLKWFDNVSKKEYNWPNPAIGLEAETKAYQKYNFATLNNKWMSTMVQVITGDLPLSAIDQAVADWNKNGGTELTKQVNELYQKRN